MKYKLLVAVVVMFLAVPNFVHAAGQNLPDLQILAITISRNSTGERIGTVTFMNTGRASTSPRFNLTSDWLDSTGAVMNSCDSGAAVESLARGRVSTAVARSCPAEVAERATKLRVTIDASLDPSPEANNLVPESNESNNSKTIDIPLPDLKILNITLTRNSEGVRIGNVTFMNTGRASTPPRFNLTSDWLDSTGAVINSCDSGAAVKSLLPGRISTAIARSCPAEVAERAVKLRVTIDSSLDPSPEANNLVHESNESNNSKTVDIPLPDLKILNITLARNSEGVRIGNVTFMNAGRASTPPRFNLTSDWLDSTGAVISSCDSGAAVKSLSPGRISNAIARSCPAEDAERAVKLRVTLDSSLNPSPEANNLVYESNKSNNSKTIDIPAPDLKIEGINFRGSDLHPEVTIINKSAVPTKASARVAYDWYNINGDRLGGCYQTIGVLGRNKRYTQKDVFCGNNDSYKLATQFKATIDVGDGTSEAPQSQIVESNENNNALSSPIPGREVFIRLNPPDAYIINLDTPVSNLDISIPNTTPNITIPENTVVDIPVIENTPVIVPTPESTDITPPATTVPIVTPEPTDITPPVIIVPIVTPEPTIVVPPPAEPTPTPVVDTGDRFPSYDVTLTDDGRATYTITGKLNYYGTYHNCTGPRYFDPIIVGWGQVDTLPSLDSNNSFTTTHKYIVRNPEYTITVGIRNSCFQATFKHFTVHPKL